MAEECLVIVGGQSDRLLGNENGAELGLGGVADAGVSANGSTDITMIGNAACQLGGIYGCDFMERPYGVSPFASIVYCLTPRLVRGLHSISNCAIFCGVFSRGM